MKLWIFLLCLFSALTATTVAFAAVSEPDAYAQLTDVEMAPGSAPASEFGMFDLNNSERKHKEKLPVQLTGPLKKIQKAKYLPRNAKQPT